MEVSEYVSMLFRSVSIRHGNAERFVLLLDWDLSQHGVGGQILDVIWGLSYTLAPYGSHLHPPCSVLIIRTEHEGWELS